MRDYIKAIDSFYLIKGILKQCNFQDVLWLLLSFISQTYSEIWDQNPEHYSWKFFSLAEKKQKEI